jgi:hypothetical protein
MLTLTVGCFLVGALLALRFTVWILVPAIAFGLFTALIIGTAHDYAPGTIALASVMVALGLQLGYLAVVGTDYLFAATRMPRGTRIAPLSRPAH